MKEIYVNLKNCFGIGNLEYTFNFKKHKTYSIYAPNGVMKTSFSNTFKQLSDNKEPEEKLFGKKPIWEIKVDNKNIDNDKIVVIKSFENINTDKSQTLLLVDENRKVEYDEINNKIIIEKKRIISSLNKLSGIKQSDIESTILKDFNSTNFYDFLITFKFEKDINDYTDLKYQELFNDDVLDFLNKPDIKKNIELYFDKYNELLEKSKYFRKGLFNPSKADTISNELKKNNFFAANHKVKLSGEDEEIDNFEILNSKFSEERKAIIENAELLKIENAIKKVAVQKFREILETENIIHEFQDISLFKQKIWISYIHKEKDSIEKLKEIYKNSIERLNDIENLALEQSTLWDDVVKKFNERFYMPFSKIKIENRVSIILGQPNPSIVFVFKDEESGKDIEYKTDDINKKDFLSQGEKRAMYLLNVMFNIEARKKENLETIFIIDDIADSFDYKNKYAIIQYLKDLTNETKFYQIIMTHNFDFFRTITSRGIVSYDNSMFAYKTNKNEIILKSAKEVKSLNNPFIKDWKYNLQENKKLIASIPFVRNIIEYTCDENDDYNTLTKILHFKKDSDKITLNQLKIIYEKYFSNINFNNQNRLNEKVIDIIELEANNCIKEPEGFNLENKLVLSIAIRLNAEKYMLSKISDIPNQISSNQTSKLLNLFRNEFEILKDEINILEQVILIIPENIHINSFMFEPILDLSDIHLKELFKKVYNLK